MSEGASLTHVGRGHLVLVAEDDPVAAAIIAAAIRSRGDTPHVVGTVEEALAAMEARQYCYYVVDQQLPTGAGDTMPMLGGGECIMAAAREKDGRLSSRKCHVTPILVVTGYSSREEFISKMYELGCDGFLSKPLTEKVEVLLDRVRDMLLRAGRGEHGACAGLNRGAGPWRVAGEGVTATASVVVSAAGVVASVRVRLVIDGRKVGTRTVVEVNGEVRLMQDAKFVVLLRFVVAREKSAEGWASREELGLGGGNRDATTRIREVFEGVVPEGFNAIEGDGRGLFRLNLGVVVERVEWGALRGHPSDGVKRVAEKRGR